jgi:hypothetical protein
MVKDLLSKARRWLAYWLMRGALKVHEDTFVMMCKLCVVDIAMREQGIGRIAVEQDEDGNTQLVPIYHNTTRH